jgi:hypothetical protein
MADVMGVIKRKEAKGEKAKGWKPAAEPKPIPLTYPVKK